MNTTVQALQDLYVKLGGALTDTYETIASGEQVGNYTTIPDMIDACAQKAGAGGSSLPAVTAEDNGSALIVKNGIWDKGEISGSDNFIVTFTEENETISADKTYDEIRAAIDDGNNVVGVRNSEGVIYYFTIVASGEFGDDGAFIFANVLAQDDLTSISEIFLVKQEGVESCELFESDLAALTDVAPFVVTFTSSNGTSIPDVVDKTFSEIWDAFRNGRHIIGDFFDQTYGAHQFFECSYYSAYSGDEEFRFSRIEGTVSQYIRVNSTNTLDYATTGLATTNDTSLMRIIFSENGGAYSAGTNYSDIFSAFMDDKRIRGEFNNRFFELSGKDNSAFTFSSVYLNNSVPTLEIFTIDNNDAVTYNAIPLTNT